MVGWRFERPSDEQSRMVSLWKGPPGLRRESVILINFVPLTNSSVALQEVRKCMALFVWCYDADLVQVDQREPYYKDAFSVKRGPLPVKISPRKVRT